MSVAAGSLLRDSRVTCDRGAWERLGCHVERDHKMSHIVTLQPAFQARTTLHSHNIMQVNKTTANSQNVTFVSLHYTTHQTTPLPAFCGYTKNEIFARFFCNGLRILGLKCKITLNIDSISLLEAGRIDNEGVINVDVI